MIVPAILDTFAYWRYQYFRTAGLLIGALYIFELTYRLHMRFSM